ncbi:MAG: ABC transporter permease [Ferruginibacter sp.]|nr:ABC transporter permease [Cytophagales bacterium]
MFPREPFAKDNPGKSSPPRWAEKLLRWRCPENQREEVQGDLHELFHQWVKEAGEKKARRRYIRNVLGFLRPLPVRRPEFQTRNQGYSLQLFSLSMLRNYVKIALRNLLRHQVFSFINIGGLAVGMAVTTLIGLWVYDELSFNQYHQHYDRIAQVMENEILEQGIETFGTLPMPLSQELRTKYASDFKYVAAATQGWDQIIAYQDKKFTKFGTFAEADFPEMMTLPMLRGTRSGLKEPASVLLSESMAGILFGDADPLGKIVKIGNNFTVQVTGVYRDLPRNTAFRDVAFIAPLDLLFSDQEAKNNWRSSSFQIFTQLNPNRNFEQVSAKIKGVLGQHIQDQTKASLSLYPMARWHLYSAWKNGVNESGRIQFVWLFSIIGIFILLLACINFMNLSTARSEKRAKEVGIRKVIGSARGQIIGQFFSESLVVAAFSFILSLLLVGGMLPFFNEVADKSLSVLWTNPWFWLLGIGFSLFTGLVAGSYPALYLSSFQPINVLKGTFRVGRLAAIPRQGLVVVQFTISITLIVGTLVVFRQIQFAKNRPLGYSRQGLINITMNTPEIQGHYDALRNDLLKTGAVADMAESSSPITGIWSSANNLEWRGKDPNRSALFGTISVTPDFGKVIEWQVKAGRGFSRQFSTDSSAFVFNEAAVKLTGLQNPVGETIKWHDKNWTVIGVVKDMVMKSPFEPVMPTVFMIDNRERPLNVIHLKLDPGLSTGAALSKIEAVFKTYNPASPFEYQFADQEYAKKFAAEERIGKLASVSAVLAIFISCLGLFGLASFMAEQRTKEIGIRKVLGATVLDLWGLLSKDFVYLVILAIVVATPAAHYFFSDWLQQYEYRTEISWWIFAAAGSGALVITLATVSYQAVKAALANPVKSLRTE